MTISLLLMTISLLLMTISLLLMMMMTDTAQATRWTALCPQLMAKYVCYDLSIWPTVTTTGVPQGLGVPHSQ
jgi:hypothetical protein